MWGRPDSIAVVPVRESYGELETKAELVYCRAGASTGRCTLLGRRAITEGEGVRMHRIWGGGWKEQLTRKVGI